MAEILLTSAAITGTGFVVFMFVSLLRGYATQDKPREHIIESELIQ